MRLKCDKLAPNQNHKMNPYYHYTKTRFSTFVQEATSKVKIFEVVKKNHVISSRTFFDHNIFLKIYSLWLGQLHWILPQKKVRRMIFDLWGPKSSTRGKTARKKNDFKLSFNMLTRYIGVIFVIYVMIHPDISTYMNCL